MNLPRLLTLLALVLFGFIALAALFKKLNSGSSEAPTAHSHEIVEVALSDEPTYLVAAVEPPRAPILNEEGKKVEVKKEGVNPPEATRIEEFFNKTPPQLPIVETITYKSHVAWQKGRPAWLTDYASHYNTSRHFIARSLNGKADYMTQNLVEGDRFTILRQDKNFEFYLLVDTSRCRLWFYYIDLDQKEKVLLKTYPVCLGRVDSSKASGLLTPLGKYTLGDRIAVYKPKSMGTYLGKKTEMITIFGTRWIPFEKEIGSCTAPARGFGIHGTPCTVLPNGDVEDQSKGIGKYESDGCIRLATKDMEELYAIIITKPTVIEITRDFYDSSLLKNYPEV